MHVARSAAALLSLAVLAGCQASPPPADPTGLANSEMLRVLTAFQGTGAQPVYKLSVADARRQATIGDAAGLVAQQIGVPAKQPVANIRDMTIDTSIGALPVRIYDPKAATGPAPVIVYYHGGGWVTGTLDTYDASDRILANSTGAIVVSVAYRLGPENRFPQAQSDAAAAYNWVLNNARTIGGDPRKIAVAGESAGGNLAINTSIWARDGNLPLPVHQLLIYPVLGTDLFTPSYNQTTQAIPLNRKDIEWYVGNFTSGPADLRDPRLNVIGEAKLAGLPPTTIISAYIDPLRSEGEALGPKLQAAGVDAQQRTYPGVTHEFFGMGAVLAEAKQAEDFAASRLKASFAQVPEKPAMRTRPMRRHPM